MPGQAGHDAVGLTLFDRLRGLGLSPSIGSGISRWRSPSITGIPYMNGDTGGGGKEFHSYSIFRAWMDNILPSQGPSTTILTALTGCAGDSITTRLYISNVPAFRKEVPSNETST